MSFDVRIRIHCIVVRSGQARYCQRKSRKTQEEFIFVQELEVANRESLQKLHGDIRTSFEPPRSTKS
jgi:hypothetical protein